MNDPDAGETPAHNDAAEPNLAEIVTPMLDRRALALLADGPRRLLVVDEFHRNAFTEDLPGRLRATPGVPSLTYLVRDGKVFVFDKLLALVRAVPALASAAKPDPEAVLAFLPQCWLPALEAVREWRVAPYPYRLVDPGDPALPFSDRFGIHHGPLGASIPVAVLQQGRG